MNLQEMGHPCQREGPADQAEQIADLIAKSIDSNRFAAPKIGQESAVRDIENPDQQGGRNKRQAELQDLATLIGVPSDAQQLPVTPGEERAHAYSCPHLG